MTLMPLPAARFRTVRDLGVPCLLGALAFASACGSRERTPQPEQLKLCINEVMPGNRDTVADEFGEYDDWIELYNPGTEPASLEGLYLTDDAQSPMKHALPAGEQVPAGGFLILWADGDLDQGELHLRFRLSAEQGESIWLNHAFGQSIDSVIFGPQAGQESYARYPDGGQSWQWCSTPTPGVANGPTCMAQPADSEETDEDEDL